MMWLLLGYCYETQILWCLLEFIDHLWGQSRWWSEGWPCKNKAIQVDPLLLGDPGCLVKLLSGLQHIIVEPLDQLFLWRHVQPLLLQVVGQSVDVWLYHLHPLSGCMTGAPGRMRFKYSNRGTKKIILSDKCKSKYISGTESLQRATSKWEVHLWISREKNGIILFSQGWFGSHRFFSTLPPWELFSSKNYCVIVRHLG